MHAIDKRPPTALLLPPSPALPAAAAVAVDPVPSPSGRLVGLINGSNSVVVVVVVDAVAVYLLLLVATAAA